MLFRKDIEPQCAYCRHGSALEYGKVACRKAGIVSGQYHCRWFKYDPLRREPHKPAALKKDYKPEDFAL